jgi:predicted acetyltransferase
LLLLPPSADYKESYLEALAEYHAEGRHLDLDAGLLATDFETFVRDLVDRSDPCRVRPGRVPESVLWMIDRGAYIGRVSIRHELNEQLLRIGGHIGYEVRPGMRRRGHGTRALRLALDEARKLGLCRVLLTCDPENIASRKIIERNGGRLEDAVPKGGEHMRRYWIDLDR